MKRWIAPGPFAMNHRMAERLFLRAYELELEEAQAERVWAWRRAAWSVDDARVKVVDLWSSGGAAALREIQSVGPSISAQLATWISDEIAGGQHHCTHFDHSET